MFDLTVDILQRSTLVLNDEGQNTIQYNTILAHIHVIT